MFDRSPRMLFALLVFIGAFLTAPAALAQASTCGVPGAPLCTPTPRPAVRATAVPQVEQPTAAPTPEAAPTEVPLRPLPSTGPCVAAPNGNFRVNVRNFPSTDSGETTSVLSPDAIVPVLARFTAQDGSPWVLDADGGFLSGSALRYGGETCDDLIQFPIPAGSGPFILSHDLDGDGTPDVDLGLRLPTGKETADDDVCIEYPYHDPYNPGKGGTVCLPFDIDKRTAVCVKDLLYPGTHCVVVDPAMESALELDLTAGGTPVPEDGRSEATVFWMFPESNGIVIANPTSGDETADDDICIEYKFRDPYNPKGGGTICVAADLAAGSVYCQNGHCVVIEE